MPTQNPLAPPALKLALGIAGTGLAAIGIVFANAESLVERQFERALALKAIASAEGQTGATTTVSVAGSEEYWLDGTKRAGTHPVAWSKSVSVGDRFSIGAGGAERLMEVVDIRELPGGSASVDAGGRQAKLQVVTCRDVGHERASPVRFLIEVGEPLVPTSAKTPHAL